MKKETYKIKFKDESFDKDYSLSILKSKIAEGQEDFDWLVNYALDLGLDDITTSNIKDLIEENRLEEEHLNYLVEQEEKEKEKEQEQEKYVVYGYNRRGLCFVRAKRGDIDSNGRRVPAPEYTDYEEKARRFTQKKAYELAGSMTINSRRNGNNIHWKVKEV